jgi:hypothetical protein
MQKPHRFVISRVAGYAEEGSAFLRRRRIRSQPFVRVWREGGAVEAVPEDSPVAARLSAAAARLLEGHAAG